MLSGWPRLRNANGMLSGYSRPRNANGMLSGYPIRASAAITLNSSANGAVTGASYSHVVASKNSSLLIVIAGEWSGSYHFTGATVNGVAGTQLFVQSSVSPSFLRAWYWLDSQLPAPGTWSVLVSGPTLDAAAISMLFDNVSQGSPIVYANAASSGSASPTIPVTTPGDATFAGCGELSSNAISSAGSLNTALTRSAGNIKVACAWGAAASAAAFTGSGDTRTSIGAASIRAA